jgi:biopolymer transport protein ExbD
MAKFERKGKKRGAAISTASLPDIVFMLLFFFMVTTVMRDQDELVTIEQPTASEIVKLENKAMVDYILVGPPNDEQYGTEPRIQLNDAFAKLSQIQDFVEKGRENRDEKMHPAVVTSLKVDKGVKMGVITDIKQELREVQALKINYSTGVADDDSGKN